MRSRRPRLIALAAVVLPPLLLWPVEGAQQPPPPGVVQTVQQAPQTPDRTAFLLANSIQDPQRKVEALEKVLADFPGTGGTLTIHQAIFDTFLKSWPDRTDQIAARAQQIVDATPESSRGTAYTTLATRLLDAGIMLDTAQAYAEKAVTLVDEEVARTARQRRAVPLAALGRIYLRTGKTAEGEKVLKEAYEGSPLAAGAAAAALAELADKNGNASLALDYWLSAAISGRMTAAQRGQLENAYRAGHSGSLEGLEALLDATYRRAYPETFTPPAYAPRSTRTTRTALVEVFTGAGCPPCLSSSLASDYVQQRYAAKDVIVLMYHEHIPVPDPMVNPSTEAYARYYAVTSAPIVAFDGVKTIQGGPNLREQVRTFYDRMVSEIDKRLEVAADADIALDVNVDGVFVNAKARVSNLKAATGRLRLQIALVEDGLTYNGENTIRFHPMVVRNLAGPSLNGFEFEPAKPSAEWRFDLVALSTGLKKYLDDYEKRPRATPYTFMQKKDLIDPAHLSVVAFLQDDQTKKVLQATSVKVRQ